MYFNINYPEKENLLLKLKSVLLVKQNKILQNNYIYSFFKDNDNFDDKLKFIQFAKDIQIVKNMSNMNFMVNKILKDIFNYKHYELDAIMNFFNTICNEKFIHLVTPKIKVLFLKLLKNNSENLEILNQYLKSIYYSTKINLCSEKELDMFFNDILDQVINFQMFYSDFNIDFFDTNFNDDKIVFFEATQQVGDIEGYELYYDPDEMVIWEIKLTDNILLEFLAKYDDDSRLNNLLFSLNEKLKDTSQLQVFVARDNSGIVILSDFPQFGIGDLLEGYSDILDYCKSKLSQDIGGFTHV